MAVLRTITGLSLALAAAGCSDPAPPAEATPEPRPVVETVGARPSRPVPPVATGPQSPVDGSPPEELLALAARVDKLTLQLLRAAPAGVDVAVSGPALATALVAAPSPPAAVEPFQGTSDALQLLLRSRDPRCVLDHESRQAARGKLVAAAAWKAEWASPFSIRSTSTLRFRVTPDRTVEATSLWDYLGPFRYALVDGVRVVEIPYACGDVALLLISPDTGPGNRDALLGSDPAMQELARRAGVPTPSKPPPPPSEQPKPRPLSSIEAMLSTERIARWISQLQSAAIRIEVPRFRVTSRLEVDGASHDVTFEFDERGSLSGDYARVVYGPRGAPRLAANLDFDRPFLFLVRDYRTGVLLVAGRVTEPHDPGDPPPDPTADLPSVPYDWLAPVPGR